MPHVPASFSNHPKTKQIGLKTLFLVKNFLRNCFAKDTISFNVKRGWMLKECEKGKSPLRNFLSPNWARIQDASKYHYSVVLKSFWVEKFIDQVEVEEKFGKDEKSWRQILKKKSSLQKIRNLLEILKVKKSKNISKFKSKIFVTFRFKFWALRKTNMSSLEISNLNFGKSKTKLLSLIKCFLKNQYLKGKDSLLIYDPKFIFL